MLAGIFLCSFVVAGVAADSAPQAEAEDSISRAAAKARNLARALPEAEVVPAAKEPAKRVLAVDQPKVVVTPKLTVLDGGKRLENTNLYQITQAPIVQSVKDYKGDVEYAREKRSAREFAIAEATLQKLMAADAPADIHKQTMLELALVAQDQTNITRAIQILSQYTKRFPDDERLPEIYLRQGLLYRDSGSFDLALGRFYLVLTAATQLRLEEMEYYQGLVLRAKAEIGDTLMTQGKVEEAGETYVRLLAVETDRLNRPLVQSKLIRCYAQLNKNLEAVTEGERFLKKYPDASEMPEVRFIIARIYKQTSRNREATAHTIKLLQSQQAGAGANPELWTYWQQRTGNDIANQLYREGDYLNALSVYDAISQLGTNAGWQLPAMYQMGLIYERLSQTQKASEIYGKIVATQAKPGAAKSDNSLASVVEMARWRGDYLKWIEKTAIDREMLRVGATTNIVATQ